MKIKKSTLIIVISLFCSLLTNGQINMINPNSYPFIASDAHVFEDGEMYLVSNQPYLVKVGDLNQWNTTQFRIDSLYGVKLTQIHCFNKAHCFGWGAAGFGNYIGSQSLDSGKTWQLLTRIGTGALLPMVVDSLFLVSNQSAINQYTLDGGRNWLQTPSRLGSMDNCGQAADTVYGRSSQTDSLYRITAQGLLAMAPSNFPNGEEATLLWPASNGYIVLTDSSSLYHTDWDLQNAMLIHQFNNSAANMKFFTEGDTLVHWSPSELLYSIDNGANWQASSDLTAGKYSPPQFLHNEQLHFPFGAGHFLRQNIFTGDTSLLSNNAHPLTQYFYPMGSGRFYAPQPSQFVGDTAHRPAFVFNNSAAIVSQRKAPWENIIAQNIAFADTHTGAMYHLPSEQLALTQDGGRSWQTHPNPRQRSLSHLHYSQKGTCLFAQVGGAPQVVLSEILNGFQYRDLNLAFQNPTEQLRQMYFWNCDTGMVVSNERIYYTYNGGLSFSTVNFNSSKFNTLQIKGDTIFIATRDSNYYALNPSGPFFSIDEQPVYLHWSMGTPPYHFFKRHQVIYYNPSVSRLMIADSRNGFVEKLTIPVGSISQFLPVGPHSILITGRGGQLYRVDDYRALFSNNPISNREEVYNNIELQVFPNPASESIRFISKEPISSIALFNLSGQRVLEQRDPENRISLKNLQPGIYLLRVKLENGRQVSRRLVIERS